MALHASQRVAHRIPGRRHQCAVERRGHLKHQRTLGALCGTQRGRTLDSRLAARNNQLPAAIVVGDLADLAVRCFRAGGIDLGLFQTDDRGHGPLARRHCGLHGIAANAQQARRIGNGHEAGRGKRRIFAKRMPGHIGNLVLQRKAARFERAHGRQRYRHQRRLRIGGKGKRLLRSLEDQGGELLAKRLVHFLEHPARLRKGIRQFLAHAYGLTALPRKGECDCHYPPRFALSFRVSRIAARKVKPRPVSCIGCGPPGSVQTLACKGSRIVKTEHDSFAGSSQFRHTQ
ncbi:hypothetical protein CF98_34885 [Halopseudomonas bauzanensis]|nr:hypothetical protein CF98_34885 [Halopseudomonas bauzanensis]